MELMFNGEVVQRENPLEMIEFWAELLKLEGISDETKRLIDKCLQDELRKYIEPLRVNMIRAGEKGQKEGE